MGTRAAAFKIRSLYDYQLRLMQGAIPPPSGVDIANTIKYFSQTLLTVLKDVPSSPLELLKNPDMDATRVGLFPSLDYKGLYNSIIPLIEVAPLIQIGLHAFGQAMLQCLGCLLPFLDHDLIDNLPYLTASSIAVLPSSLHQDIVNCLCFYILPFTIPRHNARDQDVSQSVSTVIMMIFQYSTNPAHHCQLIECLMALKQSILKDILSVIGYGTSTARSSAARLLFYYWPTFNTYLFDRKNLICKFAGKYGLRSPKSAELLWGFVQGEATPFTCQRDMCPNAGTAEAAKVCYDHCISITFATDTPPPLYLCIECANEIHREHPNQTFCDILHPMQQVSMVCENKNCRATDRSAISICFSTECASYNGNHPIRYCEQCHNNRHNHKRGGDHIVHKCVPPTWNMDMEMQSYMVEAIASLLKEAKIPTNEPKDSTMSTIQPTTSSTDTRSPVQSVSDNISNEDRQLLGRYGVWFLVGRCTPDESTQVEVLGRLISMLFHWFHMTAYSYDGQEESQLEKLKTESVFTWLRNISETHYDLFISCLLPHPPEYARVGGHWDCLGSRTGHLKDGLNRLFCLVPYEVITQEIWDFVMPHWMDAVVNDVPEKELPELRIILSKILDADMSPLSFDAKKMYNFVAERFEKSASAKEVREALKWLQILTILEIIIPLHLLFSIFQDGVKQMKGAQIEENDSTNTSLSEADSHNSPLTRDTRENTETDNERNLFCCILMLDILLKQMELQNIDKHTGINSSLSKDVCWLLKCMITAAWIGKHDCNLKTECTYCESSIMWHQLSLQLIKYLSPIHPAHPPDPPIETFNEEQVNRKSSPENDKKDAKSEAVLNLPVPEIHSVGGVLVHMPHVCSLISDFQIMTATVETVSEQLDLAAIMPSDKVVSAVARAITLTDSDIGKSAYITENDEPVEPEPGDDLSNFWQTSIGKFKFRIEDLPKTLQYIYQLLQELPKVEKPDILYYIVQCLNILVLHGDACTKASKEHRGFFIWCQENYLIKNLWDLCNAEHSHICQEVVPLLLHCITLPAGSDVFWRIIQDEFHSNDWRNRFVSVERVTVIARFMDPSPLRNVLPLQAALANAFCYLISSMDDPNVYVAQRATLYLGTIHDAAIQSLLMCLETQFDSVIVDRPMVLQSIYQLHNSLSERKILSWEFFLNRFDTLFLEAQINLEKTGDISYFRDLRNTDLNSDVFIRKLHRAHEALSQSNNSGGSLVKTLSSSFGTKWPYTRTMSAPASIVPRPDIKESKEKVYNRQYSAPILKRKSSRFGLGQFLNPSNSIPDGQIHALNVVDDQNLLGFLHRVIDLEEADKETMHLLVFLLLQFLSRSDQAFPTEEKSITKVQSIVLRHLYLLLGYSQNDRGLYLPPAKLRSSPAFSVYLSNLPQLLDQNHLMGRMLLSTALILLQYAPSPNYIPNSLELQQPTYSLWALECHSRRNWLMSLVVLLYKYQYSQQPHCMQLTSLIKIVLNTLDSQHHHCRKLPATILMGGPPSRSRDVSQPSLEVENEFMERASTPPPLSPIYPSDSQSIQLAMGSKSTKYMVFGKQSTPISMETHWEEPAPVPIAKKWDRTRTITEQSIDVDETESDLAAIPASDLSDSTLQGSAHDSFEENMDDTFEIGKIPPVVIEMNGSEGIDILKLGSNKVPTWFIGCDQEDSIKSWENQNNVFQDTKLDGKYNNMQCVNKISALASKIVHMKQAAQPTSTKQSSMGKVKKIIEPSITPVCTPVSDVDEGYQVPKGQLMPTPSLERLLPIGSSRPSEAPRIETQLEIPSQERLLPIGQHTKDINQLVDKVRQALGISTVPQKYEAKQDGVKSEMSLKHTSPRRLIKQVALESPPNDLDEHTTYSKTMQLELKSIVAPIYSAYPVLTEDALTEETTIFNYNRKKPRKSGPFTIGTYTEENDDRKPGSWISPSISPKMDTVDIKQSSFRMGDDCVNDRCTECGTMIEEFSDEEIGLCIVTLGTFIHREPALAAPMLPDILSIVSKVTTNAIYPWQSGSSVHLPGGAVSVAHQFLRCVLHQLAPNGVFMQMFQTHANDTTRIQFFKSVIQALIDFNELNPVAPLQLLLDSLNAKKTLPVEMIPKILENMACYLDCLPLEAALGPTQPIWTNVLPQLEILFRKIVLFLQSLDDISAMLRIMITIFKIPVISQFKGILEPFSKVLSHAIQTNILKYSYLVDLCYLCNRAFTKDRDKLFLSRTVVFEFMQALKFKTSMPDINLLMIINLILQDVGGSMLPNVVLKDMQPLYIDYCPLSSTNVSECMRLHLTDILDFLTDFHTLVKIKSYCKGASVNLNEDTLGGIIKCGIAQYLALELTRGNGRDNRAITRYMPWLYNASTIQQSSREFVECIGHIRLLSWLLLGSLTHTSLHGHGHNHHLSQPIPQEASCQIADHIQVIMAGFAEQPKSSVLHMSSLFHTFILCELWTIYLEQCLNSHLPTSEAYNTATNILLDFWSKVTPCILNLVQQSKMVSEIVSLHFLSMIEALIECHSTFIGKLLPLWTPVLCSNQIQLSSHLQVRLQNCRNFAPITFSSEGLPHKNRPHIHNAVLLKWLQRLQFKMGQIELQSSTVAQFYSL